MAQPPHALGDGRGGTRPSLWHYTTERSKCHYGNALRMTDIVSVDKAGRIVIPKAIREAVGIEARSKLLIATAGRDRIVLQKLDVESLAARLEKELTGKDVDGIVRRVREEIRVRIREEYPDLPA